MQPQSGQMTLVDRELPRDRLGSAGQALRRIKTWKYHSWIHGSSWPSCASYPDHHLAGPGLGLANWAIAYRLMRHIQLRVDAHSCSFSRVIIYHTMVGGPRCTHVGRFLQGRYHAMTGSALSCTRGLREVDPRGLSKRPCVVPTWPGSDRVGQLPRHLRMQ